MKKLIAAAFFILPLLGAAQDLQLNTEKATVTFNFVAENVQGTVGGIQATMSLDLSDLSNSVIKGTADVSTLSTGTKMRDKHLKSDDFFHAEQYPKMTFTGSSVEKKGDQYFAHGTLTIKGITKDVSFQMVTKDGILIMTTSINAADFEVSPKKPESSQVDITVKVPYS